MSSTEESATNKGVGDAASEIQQDLETLREDVARLTEQMAQLLAAKGNSAWRRAKSNIEGMMSDAEAKGHEAVDAVRGVGEDVTDAIDDSLKRRPYTTLALALAIGFLFGATWRR
ncbi:MAG: hypothetical protein ABSC37_18310 [Xanthobacteraceae bacterium]|jgi:ElaB/YqjD/DUF883 family membrane-anchored ribosome-binding protein